MIRARLLRSLFIITVLVYIALAWIIKSNVVDVPAIPTVHVMANQAAAIAAVSTSMPQDTSVTASSNDGVVPNTSSVAGGSGIQNVRTASDNTSSTISSVADVDSITTTTDNTSGTIPVVVIDIPTLQTA